MHSADVLCLDIITRVQMVTPLLRKVVERVQRKPTRSMGQIKWVRALLTQHTALLMSQPELVRSLTPLYQLVEARVQTYHKLLKLEGRLDLALSQVAGQKSGAVYVHQPELLVQEVASANADMVIGATDEFDDEEEEDDDEEEEEADEEEGESDDGMEED